MLETVSSTTQGKYKIGSFFAGVGGIELGFEKTGEFSTVYANEIDKHAQETYQLNFPETNLDKRDIKEVNGEDVPNVDVLTGGFPCQAFSIAGYRLGFEDERGSLFFDLLRLIRKKQPRVIFIENVKNMVSHDHGNTFKVIREALVLNGYHISWKVMNGMEYGNVPQNRERIYIVGFRREEDFKLFEFPDKVPLTASIKDIINFKSLEEEIYYYKEGKQKFYPILAQDITSQDTVYQWRRQYVRENKSGVVPTLTANMGTGGHNVPLILSDHGIRKLTPRETFNAQGYPNEYKLPQEMAKSHLYKQAGNSVVVPVITRIAEKIAMALSHNDQKEQDLIKESTISYLHDIKGYKYAIIKVDIKSKFEGESCLMKTFNKRQDAENFINENNSTDNLFITDEQYLSIINNGKSGSFMMLIEI